MAFIPFAVTAWLILLMGCDSNQPQTQIPTPTRDNAVIEREKLVNEFKTAEVQWVPYQDHGFIVRDSGGSVWYANMDPSKVASGKTRLFSPVGTNAVYDAVPETVPDKVADLYRTMIEASVQLQLATNKYCVTNVVYITNVFDANETLPPQMGARMASLANRLFKEFLRTNSVLLLEDKK